MLNSKKALLGSEYMMWFFRFLLVIFIVSFVTFLLFAVINRNYDVRSSEAVILSKLISNCITKDEIITPGSLDNLESCFNLDKEKVSIKLSVFNSTKVLKEKEFGRNEIQIYCDMLDEVKQKVPPNCLKSIFLINFNDGSKQIAYLNVSIALTE
jgi:hypothetical protein